MANADWAPPPGSDPWDAYKQAISDRENGDFSAALEKHIWFHDHVLDIDPSYIGVRLSYNLEEWMNLAKQYPTAKTALIEKAESAKNSVLHSNGDIRDAFHDYSSINSYLGAPADTVTLFEQLDQDAPEKSKAVFNLAFSDLLEARKYSTMGKHIDASKQLALINKAHSAHLRSLKDPEIGDDDMKEYTEQFYTYNIGALIAVLVNINKEQEARWVAEVSACKIDTDLYKDTIDKALAGVPPPKWP